MGLADKIAEKLFLFVATLTFCAMIALVIFLMVGLMVGVWNAWATVTGVPTINLVP